MRKPAEFLKSQLRLRVAAGAAIVLIAGLLAFTGVWWWPALLGALALLLLLGRHTGQGKVLDPERLRKGIVGEEAVAEALTELPPPYWVLHGVPTGHGDVDHVVIGPTGIFALETKAWEGAFYRKHGQLFCNGQPAEHVLRQARGAAGQVRQLLLEAGIEEWVDAIVVATSASVARSPLRFRQAHVLVIEDLLPFITRRSRALSHSMVVRATATLLGPDGDGPLRGTSPIG